jgi:hypothetical protein
MPLICPKLQPKEKCIYLRKYNRGDGERYIELYHEHIPQHRISADAAIEMMKALVLRHQNAGAAYILRCYVNDQGQEPEACDPFKLCTEYPEPGVFRTYCGSDLQAWIDTVIDPKRFRH